MKKFIFLIALLFTINLNAQVDADTDIGFVIAANTSGFTGTHPTFTGELNWNGGITNQFQTNYNNFTLLNIQVGDKIVGSDGFIFEIIAPAPTFTGTGMQVTVQRITTNTNASSGTTNPPVDGRVVVSRPSGNCNTLTVPPNNLLGIDDVVAAIVQNYNVFQTEHCILNASNNIIQVCGIPAGPVPTGNTVVIDTCKTSNNNIYRADLATNGYIQVDRDSLFSSDTTGLTDFVKSLINYNDTSATNELPIVTVSNTAPTSPKVGDIFQDTTDPANPVTQIWNGTSWITISTEDTVNRFIADSGTPINTDTLIFNAPDVPFFYELVGNVLQLKMTAGTAAGQTHIWNGSSWQIGTVGRDTINLLQNLFGINGEMRINDGGQTKKITVLSQDEKQQIEQGTDGGLLYEIREMCTFSNIASTDANNPTVLGNSTFSDICRNKYHTIMFETWVAVADAGADTVYVELDTTNLDYPIRAYLKYATTGLASDPILKITTNAAGFYNSAVNGATIEDFLILNKPSDFALLEILENGNIYAFVNNGSSSGSVPYPTLTVDLNDPNALIFATDQDKFGVDGSGNVTNGPDGNPDSMKITVLHPTTNFLELPTDEPVAGLPTTADIVTYVSSRPFYWGTTIYYIGTGTASEPEGSWYVDDDGSVLNNYTRNIPPKFNTPDANGKVADFQGDINVTGEIDPTSIVFSDQGYVGAYDPNGANNEFRIRTEGKDLNFQSDAVDNIIHLNQDDGNVGFGTNSPTAKVDIDGTFRLRNGSEQNGRVLKSNANGVATWEEESPLVLNEINLSNANVGVSTIANSQADYWYEFTGVDLANTSEPVVHKIEKAVLGENRKIYLTNKSGVDSLQIKIVDFDNLGFRVDGVTGFEDTLTLDIQESVILIHKGGKFNVFNYNPNKGIQGITPNYTIDTTNVGYVLYSEGVAVDTVPYVDREITLNEGLSEEGGIHKLGSISNNINPLLSNRYLPTGGNSLLMTGGGSLVINRNSPIAQGFFGLEVFDKTTYLSNLNDPAKRTLYVTGRANAPLDVVTVSGDAGNTGHSMFISQQGTNEALSVVSTGAATNGFVTAQFEHQNATDGFMYPVLAISSKLGGSASDGFGTKITFSGDDTNSSGAQMGDFGVKWHNATNKRASFIINPFGNSNNEDYEFAANYLETGRARLVIAEDLQIEGTSYETSEQTINSNSTITDGAKYITIDASVNIATLTLPALQSGRILHVRCSDDTNGCGVSGNINGVSQTINLVTGEALHLRVKTDETTWETW